MKKIICLASCLILLVSCGSTKQAQSSVYSTKTTDTSLEGETVIKETMRMQGIEMSESLSEDGTKIIQIPYQWFAGIGKADNKQMAIEIAQREAYATISRFLTNAVMDGAKKGNVSNNAKVLASLNSHWEQVSNSLIKGVEPFGDVTIEYSPSTRMYSATAKVAVRGDKFNELINNAGNFQPTDLSGDELKQFIEVNKTIMEAARGN